MLKETEKTIVFFVTFLALVAFELRDRAPWAPPGYTYVLANSGVFPEIDGHQNYSLGTPNFGKRVWVKVICCE